jgi:D-lactate dehydrogenase
MRYPELAQAATQHMTLPAGCRDGYSTARTCELNVSNAAGFDFRCVRVMVEGGRGCMSGSCV